MVGDQYNLPIFPVGCLGPRGTHSEELALRLFAGSERQLRLYPCIDAAIRAVAAGESAECVAPFENSLEGAVNITLDTLVHEVDLFITQEVVWPVRNHLLVRPGDGKIRTIVSHPQALAQCRRYLAQHYPGAVLKAMSSTAEAAELVASGECHYAAIGSRRAAEIHGLDVLATDIQDETNNCTRFVVLSRTPAVPVPGQGKTSFVCQIDGEKPGSLWRVLEEFARRDVNLTRIESRPARTGLGQYIFFFDLAGSSVDDNIQSALTSVRAKTFWYKDLGSYRNIDLNQNK